MLNPSKLSKKTWFWGSEIMYKKLNRMLMTVEDFAPLFEGNLDR